MGQYVLLQELFSDNTDVLDQWSAIFKKYVDCLVNVRSILSDWVETQDWSEICRNPVTTHKECLEEALSLLQDRIKNNSNKASGFEFHIRDTVLQLKKSYGTQPSKFVEDIRQVLEEEKSLIQKVMDAQAMCEDGEGIQWTREHLEEQIKICADETETMMKYLKCAAYVAETWKGDIESGSRENRDIFKDGKKIHPPIDMFVLLRNEVEKKTGDLPQKIQIILAALKGHITLWQRQQLYQCVRRLPEDWLNDKEPFSYVEHMCQSVCKCLNQLMKCATSGELQVVDAIQIPAQRQELPVSSIPTPSLISNFTVNLGTVARLLLNTFLVVMEQPPLTMMIEKEKVKEKDDVNNSKRFSTTVGILGGKGLEDGFQIQEVEIYLRFNHDLASNDTENRFNIHHDRSTGRCAAYADPQPSYAKTYEKLRVEHFNRKETKYVYKQLYHVVYEVKVFVPPLMLEIPARTYSLPVIVRTGANQASEHIGAQLWHSFSASNVYDLNAEIENSMKVEDVIKMLNQRILFIGGRPLQPYERQFLGNRLMMAASGKSERATGCQTSITLDTFIKDKVMLPKQGGNASQKDLMQFSLWRWLHSIINLLEETLKKPWCDGIIYGFASREQCIQALNHQPDGTFLLRFSESFLSGNYLLSKGGLAVVVQKEGHAGFPPPMKPEAIEKDGLAHMISKTGCKSLYNSKLQISDLLSLYPPVVLETDQVQGRYLGWNQSDEYGNVASPEPAAPAEKRKPPKKAKRQCATSQSKSAEDLDNPKQYRQAGPWSPESAASSVMSPQVLSPGSPEDSQFQPVGIRQQGFVVGEAGIPNLSELSIICQKESLEQSPGGEAMEVVELLPGTMILGSQIVSAAPLVSAPAPIPATVAAPASTPALGPMPQMILTTMPVLASPPVATVDSPSQVLTTENNPMMSGAVGDQIELQDLQKLDPECVEKLLACLNSSK